MDRDLIRKHYEDLPTADLLRDLLMNADSFQPAALEVIQTVLESRRGSLTALVKEQADCVGTEVCSIDGVKGFTSDRRYEGGPRHGKRVDAADGVLRLTDQGLGFVAKARDKELSLMMTALGGPIGYAIAKAEDRATPDVVPEDLRSLPVSLIAEIDPHSAWFPVEHMEQLTLQRELLHIIHPLNPRCTVPSAAHDALRSWAEQVELTVTDELPPKRGSWWQRLLGRS